MPDEIEEIKRRIDIVDLISSYLTLKKAGTSFKTLCPFHQEKVPSFYVSPEKQIFKCFGCFPKGSLIKTYQGLHAIEKIKEGTSVITDKGRPRSVICTHRRFYKGDLIEIQIRKLGGKVRLTSDHQVFTLKKAPYIQKYKDLSRRFGNYQKLLQYKYFDKINRYFPIIEKPAGDLTTNDFLLYPIDSRTKDKRFIYIYYPYLKKRTRHGLKPPKIPIKIPLDADFLKLIGYYIAEGSSHRAYIRFSLGNHEEKLAQEIINLIKKVFNLKAKIHRRHGKKSGLEITCCHSRLANIFKNLCGKDAENKHIPFELQTMPSAKQKILLEAIHKGDGYEARASRSNRFYKAITITSQTLTEQLRDILLRMNIFPTVNISEARKDKKGVSHRKSFQISWYPNGQSRYNLVYKKKSGAKYWILPIKKIERIPFVGPVYNLTINQDHSYIANNFAVANCGKAGDIFDFLMEMENLEFVDALKLLAEKAGVQLKRLDKKEYKEQKEEKTKLYEINSWAAKFFHKILIGKPKAQFVRDYLKARQISQKSIQDFMLGYAPDSYDMLSNFLESKGYSKLDINNSGLTIKSDKKPGEYYDRFRDRLMFPIFDVMGNVIAFTGRAMRQTEAGKYVNSPDTPIYSKSRVLYGLAQAKKAIKEKNKMIIVEGQMDVIATHQRGYKNVVASSGTALTPFQLETISRFTKNLTFAFDQDKAGEEATKRGIDLAHRAGFDVKIILTPKGKDPDECLRENPKLWEKAVSEEKGAMDYYFEIAFSKRPKELDASSKKEIATELLPAIKNLSDQIVQSHYIQKLAELLNTPEKFLFEALEKIKKPAIQQPQKSQPKPPPSIEERLLGLILAKPEFQSDFFKKVNIADFQNPKFKEIAQNLQKYYNQTALFNLNSFKKKIPQYSIEIDLLTLPFENVTDSDFLQKEYSEYVTRFSTFKIEKIKKVYEEKIKEAEKSGDKTKVKELIKEFQKEIIGK